MSMTIAFPLGQDSYWSWYDCSQNWDQNIKSTVLLQALKTKHELTEEKQNTELHSTINEIAKEIQIKINSKTLKIKDIQNYFLRIYSPSEKDPANDFLLKTINLLSRIILLAKHSNSIWFNCRMTKSIDAFVNDRAPETAAENLPSGSNLSLEGPITFLKKFPLSMYHCIQLIDDFYQSQKAIMPHEISSRIDQASELHSRGHLGVRCTNGFSKGVEDATREIIPLLTGSEEKSRRTSDDKSTTQLPKLRDPSKIEQRKTNPYSAGTNLFRSVFLVLDHKLLFQLNQKEGSGFYEADASTHFEGSVGVDSWKGLNNYQTLDAFTHFLKHKSKSENPIENHIEYNECKFRVLPKEAVLGIGALVHLMNSRLQEFKTLLTQLDEAGLIDQYPIFTYQSSHLTLKHEESVKNRLYFFDIDYLKGVIDGSASEEDWEYHLTPLPFVPKSSKYSDSV